jgi:uroporphyrinogen-III synthase
MNRMNDETDFAAQKLGALIDDSVDLKTRQWIESLAHETIVRHAAVAGPSNDARLKNFANQLLIGEIDAVMFLTAGGVSQFFERAARTVDGTRLMNSLKDTKTITVGRCAGEMLAEIGIQPTLAIESTAWRDVLIRLEQEYLLANMVIGLEITADVHGIAAGLEARGCIVTRIDAISFEQSDPSASEQDILDAIEDGELGTLLLPTPLCAARFAYLIGRRQQPILQKNSGQLVILALDRQTEEMLADRGMNSDIVLRKRPSRDF